MAMEEFDLQSEYRRKRRKVNRPPRPIDARLFFDEQFKDDGAILSQELYEQVSQSL